MADALESLRTALAERYAIERELGSGGMATVYLAQDLKHERHVALKVLRPELAAILGVERFLSEIRVTAHLQHPHILPLFDSGQAAGLIYYVMPYIAGESLRDRLNREKQLAIEEALEITRAAASALDYAHRHGVVHRDIKPENILLHDGQAVVTDFGIALALSAAGGNRLTETGLSLGTPQYMSPEQATGDRLIDHRTDIYSLACVLYEMLSGEPPHTGPTVQAVIARVIADRPRRLVTLRDAVPPHVEAAVHKALAKIPADRFTSVAQFAEALARPGSLPLLTGAEGLAELPDTGRRRWGARVRRWAPWAVAATALSLAAWGWLRERWPEPRPVMRFTLSLEPGIRTGVTTGPTIALSPNAERLAYVAAGEGPLFLRPLDGLESVPIPGTDNGYLPFFSPDGRTLGYAVPGELRKVPLDGGPPATICKVADQIRGAFWAADDVILFSSGRSLWRVPAGGGEPKRLAEPDSGTAFVWPEVLPGERAVVFTKQRGGRFELAAMSLTNGRVVPLNQAGTNPRFVEPGFLVFATSSGDLLAARFDPTTLRITSDPVPAAQEILVAGGGAAKLGISATGAFAYAAATGGSRELKLLDRSGRAETVSLPPGYYQDATFSPDGQRVALEVSYAGFTRADFWLLDLVRNNFTRLTFDSANTFPVFTRDGTRIALGGRASDDFDLRWLAADGSDSTTTLRELPGSQFPHAFTPDGHTLVFVEHGDRRADILTLPLEAKGPPKPYLQGRFAETAPALSPDGRWLAYVSDESGRVEVYVRAFPDPGPRIQVSNGGGTEPVWRRDGRELFYRSAEGLVAVQVTTSGPGFNTGPRQVLFDDAGYATGSNRALYDVHPDGQHFLMITQGEGRADAVIVLNWFDRLRQGR